MKKLNVPQSGSAADITASRNRFGQYDRTRAMPVQPRTERQTLIRGLLTEASQAWRGLTDAVRAAWNAYASVTPSLDSLGQTVYPTGHQRFVGLYVALSNAGLAVPPTVPVEAPPAPPIFDSISLFDDGTFTVSLTDAPTVAQPALIEVSPQASAGVSFNGDYRFLLAATAQPVGGIDLAAAYTAKFGAPILGRRIFVRVSLINVDGGKSLPAVTSAVVAAAGP